MIAPVRKREPSRAEVRAASFGFNRPGTLIPMPRVDHFPSTHATWIDAQLTIIDEPGDAAAAASSPRAERARASLRTHLWERYHAPLRAYAHGGSLRRAGDPDDLVAGYFAERVTAPEFLREWRRTDMPLRRWMMNGLGFYARGVVRDRMRDRLRTFTDAGAGAATSAAATGAGEPTGAGLGEALDALAADDRTAEDAFDRAWAIAVLDAAHAHAHAELAAEGRLDAYEVFRRRVIEGEGYETIGPSIGLDAQQCAGATRLVSQRMARALREVLRAEGVRESEMDATMAEVRRAVGDAGGG